MDQPYKLVGFNSKDVCKGCAVNLLIDLKLDKVIAAINVDKLAKVGGQYSIDRKHFPEVYAEILKSLDKIVQPTLTIGSGAAKKTPLPPNCHYTADGGTHCH